MKQKEKRLELSRDEWKAKNRARYEEIKALKMRLKETSESRDKWKALSREKEATLTQLEKIQFEKDKILKDLASELEDLKKNKLEVDNQGGKCRGHFYPIFIILICLRLLLQVALPFRGLSKTLKTLDIAQHYQIKKTPSHTTIRRWTNRLGLFQLIKEKEKADDWCYIVDNSVRIESRKLCLVIGLRLSKLKKEGYLTFEDVEILEIGLINGKATQEVEKFLESAIKKTGVPLQICSDQGSDVVPAIKLIIAKYPSIKHLPDVIHATSNILKKMLKKNTRWEAFAKKVGQAKNKLKQSQYSALCPPRIRGKSRFLNCGVVIDWALRVIDLIESKDVDAGIIIKLGWLFDYKNDIIEMQQMIKMVKLVNELVRSQRINSTTWCTADILLKDEAKTEKEKKLAQEIIEFLKKLSMMAEESFLVGSSEIIESAFGKLKLLDRECGNSGFTSSILGLGACFGKLDYETVKQAMESVSDKTVKEWKIQTIGETHQSKRRRLLKSKKSECLSQKLTRILERNRAAA